MNAHSHLTDRMPSVAAGATRWSAADEQHLMVCEECRIEWALLRQTRALGKDIERNLDLNAIEAGVLAALRAPPRRWAALRPWAWLTPLAAAAALVLLLIEGKGGTAVEQPPALLPELETLSSSELESILTLLPATATRSPDGFEDLTESELASVLKDLEG